MDKLEGVLVCRHRLMFVSREELNQWKTVFEDVIARSLGDDTVCTHISVLALG